MLYKLLIITSLPQSLLGICSKSKSIKNLNLANKSKAISRSSHLSKIKLLSTLSRNKLKPFKSKRKASFSLDSPKPEPKALLCKKLVSSLTHLSSSTWMSQECTAIVKRNSRLLKKSLSVTLSMKRTNSSLITVLNTSLTSVKFVTFTLTISLKLMETI